MKYRIESPEFIYEAEKSQDDFQKYLDEKSAGKTKETWFRIIDWSKKYPIL